MGWLVAQMYSDVMLLLARTSPEPPREQARHRVRDVALAERAQQRRRGQHVALGAARRHAARVALRLS